MFFYILLAITILLAMIAIHELGHYLVGKIFKFKINEFAIGMGPALLRKRMKSGEYFSIRILPLGGYCAFYDGEEEDEKKNQGDGGADPFEESNKNTVGDAALGVPNEGVSVTCSGTPRAASTTNTVKNNLNNSNSHQSQTTNHKPLKFNDQKPYKRILVLLGGAAFNFISAVVFSFIFILVIGAQTVSVYALMQTPDGEYYNDNLRAGDRIIAVNGREINMLNPFHSRVGRVSEDRSGEVLVFTLLNDGVEREEEVTIRLIQSFNNEGVLVNEFYGFGFTPLSGTERVGFFRALLYSVPFTFQISWQILVVLGNLITGQIPMTALSGPVGIVSGIATTAASNNARDILMLLPFIASNLAIVNLLPLPALDGSKIIFTGIEWVRKKPIKRKVEMIIHLVGIVFLLGLMLILTFFDVARLI
ncbi:MAG: site-2 protease family protein [Firmicutes bacterium]|nr:site-2 protease family protein [Bacillota bacterium]